MKRLLLGPLLPASLIFSCSQPVKMNYYLEIKETKPGLFGGGFTTDYYKDTFQEINDSAAYARAFGYFCSNAKIYKDIKATTVLGKPIQLKLFNDHYVDITQKLSDTLKRKIETIKLEQAIRSGLNKDSITDIINSTNRIEYIVNDIETLYKNNLLDTAGVYKAPVKVIAARLVQREYSNYKDIRLTYKNVSNKTITAIRFSWYGLNSFNEPADMGSTLIRAGFGGGFTDGRLMPGKSNSGTWEILSKDGKKVVLAWPYEVAFEDGTKWKLEN